MFSLKTIKQLLTSHKTNLQTHPNKNNPNSNHKTINKKSKSFSKRMSSCTFRGSLTIEAALIVPCFTIALLQFIAVIEIMSIHMEIETALHQCTKELACYKYAGVDFAVNSVTATLGNIGFNQMYVADYVIKQVGRERLDQSFIKNGSRGIQFYESKILDNEDVYLVASYTANAKIALLPFPPMNLRAVCKIHGFVGYDLSENNSFQSETEYVYVTETGTVYHKKRNCTYLKLSIKGIEKNRLVSERNDEGSIYKACKICKKSVGFADLVIVTNLGNRYHNTFSCKGLKRTVTKIPINEAGGRPCSRCGMK